MGFVLPIEKKERSDGYDLVRGEFVYNLLCSSVLLGLNNTP